jgi:tRNA pseudouridine38-40 synthase
MIPTFAFTPLDQNVVEDYRITKEVLESLREILKIYLGTKNFHNFTSRRKSTDPSSKRYIMSFTASDPFIKDEKEYLILRVKGQSFMLHQIRKMIGLAVAYMRGFAGKDTFTKTWALDRIDIPKAPGVGLVLDQVIHSIFKYTVWDLT